MDLGIFYRDQEVKELYLANSGIKTELSAGFDLVLVTDLSFSQQFEFQFADFGIVIEIPQNYHSLVIPRSSTYMRYQIMQANGIGLIDQDYCGEGDYLKAPFISLAKEPITIKKGTRLCQLVLSKTEAITGLKAFKPGDPRGGFGSTGL